MTFPYVILIGFVALVCLAGVAWAKREQRRSRERLAALLEHARRELR